MKQQTIELERYLWNLERAYWNCRLEWQEVEYIWNEQRFIDLYKEIFWITVLIPEEWLREACDKFYKKWNIKH